MSAKSLDPTSCHLSRCALLRRGVARLNNQRLSADSHPALTGRGVVPLECNEDKPAGLLSAAVKKDKEKFEHQISIRLATQLLQLEHYYWY